MSFKTITTPFWGLTTTVFSFSRKPTQPLALMALSTSSKRSICPSCAKPPRTCLCSRFRSPPLDNSVHVTILQHSLEKNHPLNSTRIAKLGLKNVTVVDVKDVLTEALFVIRLIKDCEVAENRMPAICENAAMKKVSDAESDSDLDDVMESVFDHESDEGLFITVTMGRYGSNCSCELQFLPQVSALRLSFDQILNVPEVASSFSDGFVVKRIGHMEREAEFELNVPRGTVLLFPSDNSVGVIDLEKSGIEVKNLIVLDGTWAKATRMYNENPWLKALPHLKLELDKSSLYGEVRTQPKEKCLSTIESIVYALKAVGASPDGMDGLLDVFESMVGDQRRCMHERLSTLPEVQ